MSRLEEDEHRLKLLRKMLQEAPYQNMPEHLYSEYQELYGRVKSYRFVCNGKTHRGGSWFWLQLCHPEAYATARLIVDSTGGE